METVVIPVNTFEVDTGDFVMPFVEGFFQGIEIVVGNHEDAILCMRCTAVGRIRIFFCREALVFEGNTGTAVLIGFHVATKDFVRPSAVMPFEAQDARLTRIGAHNTEGHFDGFRAGRREFHGFGAGDIFAEQLCNVDVHRREKHIRTDGRAVGQDEISQDVGEFRVCMAEDIRP